MSGRRGFGEERQKSNRKGGGVIRGQSEHKDRSGSKMFPSDGRWGGGGGGEIGENRDGRQEGGSRATVPWQQAVEAGKMAAGDTTPGQIWPPGPGAGLLSLHQRMDEAGRTIYRQRVAAPSPVSLMRRAGMSDAGLGPKTQTQPCGSSLHSQPHIYSH